MRGRGFGRGGNQNRSDLFRSRPPNTSRPPSMHVDDFDKFMAQNQQGPPILAVGMNAPRRTDVNTYVASTNVSGCICQNVCIVCNTYVVCMLYVYYIYCVYCILYVYLTYLLILPFSNILLPFTRNARKLQQYCRAIVHKELAQG